MCHHTHTHTKRITIVTVIPSEARTVQHLPVGSPSSWLLCLLNVTPLVFEHFLAFLSQKTSQAYFVLDPSKTWKQLLFQGIWFLLGA